MFIIYYTGVSGPGSDGEMDLDAVASTQSLQNSAAKHKLAIKQKNKRARGNVRQPRRITSSPVVCSVITKYFDINMSC